MKNLINAITAENRKRLESFIIEINKVEDLKGLDTWQYNDLLPKGKKISDYLKAGDVVGNFEAIKAYLIKRKEKAVNKSIEREVNRIKQVYSAGTLESVKISVEWKKSRMWGANPTAECWYTYKKDGNTHSNYVKSGSIGGCGYDKLSTAVAECLTQIDEVLKMLYVRKNNNIKEDNRQLFGYGSGHWILPSIEGGVGVSCYPAIFEKFGFEFKTVASGKTFDVFTISK